MEMVVFATPCFLFLLFLLQTEIVFMGVSSYTQQFASQTEKMTLVSSFPPFLFLNKNKQTEQKNIGFLFVLLPWFGFRAEK